MTEVATSHRHGRAARAGLYLLASAALHILVFALLREIPGKGTAHEPAPRTIEFAVVEVPPPIVHSGPAAPVGSPAAQEARPRRAKAGVKKPQQVATLQQVEPSKEVVALSPPRFEPSKEVVPPLPLVPDAGPEAEEGQREGGKDGGTTGGGSGAPTGGGAGGALASVPGGGGGGTGPVTGPSYVAAYLHNPPPLYPPVARRMKLQGTTIVRVLVSSEGRPQRVAVETSSGVELLDEAALEAVWQWSFVPAKQGQKAISAEVNVPMRFRLTGASGVPADGDDVGE